MGGTQPTVTDANLVTGRLNAGYFLGGEVKLDYAAAEAAIRDCIAHPLGITTLEAARGIMEVANATMIRAIKLVSVERGRDPHDYALIAFGGPTSTRLGEELSPGRHHSSLPGNTSALGRFGGPAPTTLPRGFRAQRRRPQGARRLELGQAQLAGRHSQNVGNGSTL
jgi:N-methylhydantoinase A